MLSLKLFEHMKSNKFRFILLSYMILILIGSSLSGYSFPDYRLFTFDKLLHIIEYSILGILGIKSLRQISFTGVVLVIFGGILFAGVDELWQYFTPGRFASRYDVLADTIGILIGVVITIVYLKRIND